MVKTKIELMELDDPDLIKECPRTKSFLLYFKDELKKYNKTLLLRESQLGSLVFVIENVSKLDFKQKYLGTYGELDKFIISPEEAQKPINTVIL